NLEILAGCVRGQRQTATALSVAAHVRAFAPCEHSCCRSDLGCSRRDPGPTRKRCQARETENTNVRQGGLAATNDLATWQNHRAGHAVVAGGEQTRRSCGRRSSSSTGRGESKSWFRKRGRRREFWRTRATTT